MLWKTAPFLAPLLLAALPAGARAQLTNLALTGTASQSSTSHPNAPASDAIDGSIDGNWYNDSVTHTLNQPGTWWEVALGGVHAIDEIRLYNRADCCADRLSNFRLSVFQGTSETWGQHFFPPLSSTWVPQGRHLAVLLPIGTMGDRVRVELQGLNAKGDWVLSLAEVQVLQYGPAPLVNIAPSGTAHQSSTDYNGFPGLAIDGVPDGYWGNGSVSHTQDLPGSWWEVDLASRHNLDRIRVFNRSDCCADRLSNFRLSVFDGSVETFGQVYFAGSGNVPIGGVLSVDLPAGTVGDRVRIELQGLNNAGTGILSLAEVEVLRFEPGLVFDKRKLSTSRGGVQELGLIAGTANGARQYLVLGSFSGTAPGLPLGSALLQLVPDGYFLFTLNNPNTPPLGSTLGQLDARGCATATFTLPAGYPSLIGLTFYHAYLLFDPSLNITVASNATQLIFRP